MRPEKSILARTTWDSMVNTEPTHTRGRETQYVCTINLDGRHSENACMYRRFLQSIYYFIKAWSKARAGVLPHKGFYTPVRGAVSRSLVVVMDYE